MKNLYLDTKKQIYRATAIMFIVQLFGALGAGFFFILQNVLQLDHVLGATGSANEPTLWFILFWATDFFFVAMAVVVAYLIAGIPAIAPSLALSVYFCHFTAQTVPAVDMYTAYFATPSGYANSTSIGYLGYLIMAVMLALLIKLLYAGWDRLKTVIGKALDPKLDKLKKKIKLIPQDMTGLQLIENVDLIVLILIVPVASAALTFIFMKYGIEQPFAALSKALGGALTSLSASNVVLAAAVMGLMVGFDLIGPVSLSAFAVATAAYIETGNAQLITIYSVCFITVGWSAFFAVIFVKLFKKGTAKSDTDEWNLVLSGPINAFFENIKLTTAFSMPYACRSPLTTIPGLMAGSAFGAVVTAVFGIVNTTYTDGSVSKFTTDALAYDRITHTFEQLFEKGELYISFTLPLRSGNWLTCRLPLFFIILISGAVGGLVTALLKQGESRFLSKRGCYYYTESDIVLEMRRFAHSLSDKLKGKNTEKQPVKDRV